MSTSPQKCQLIPHFYSAARAIDAVRGLSADLNKLITRSSPLFSFQINDLAARKADLLFRKREITTQKLRYTLR